MENENIGQGAYVDASMDVNMDASKHAAGVICKFYNCRLLRSSRIYWDDLWVRDGIILDPQKCFYGEKLNAGIRIDCGRRLIVAGYIDSQINGAFGVDFSYPTPDTNTEEGVLTVAKGLLSRGVTSFCPTLVTSPPEVYHKIIPRVVRCDGSKNGAGVLGLHLEGPFISKEKKGAHPEDCIISDMIDRKQKGDEANILYKLEEIYGAGFYSNTSVITVAPELYGALEVIERLTKTKHITVSIGHSVGTIKDGEKAVRAGATFITHLFNAMLPFHHRDPGLVGLLTSWKLPENSMVYYGMIADGIHTHPATMRIAHRTHPGGLVLVSDAMCAAGLESGTYRLGQQIIDVVGKGRAFVAGTQTLAGSVAFLDECVKTFYQDTECTQVEALEGATLHPAEMLGVSSRKGTLAYGSDADFIILDDELSVVSTYIAGLCVYSKLCSLGQPES